MKRIQLLWSIVVVLATAAPTLAQVDPEAGDTGAGWQPPPADGAPAAEESETPPPVDPNAPTPAPTAVAAEPETPPDPTAWGAPAPAPRQWFGDQTAPTREEEENGEEDEDIADHDLVSTGISFFGVDSIDVAVSSLSRPLNMALPIVGVRHWFGMVGLDVGLGLGTSTVKTFDVCPMGMTSTACGDSVRTGGIDGAFAFGLHVGVPVALASSEHASLLLIPELDFAYGTATFFSPIREELDVKMSGFQIGGGIRVGGEFHFGGIGLHNLSVQVTVGLGLRYASRAAENTTVLGEGSPVVDVEETDLSVRTIASDLMNGTVRLNYYF